MLRIPPLVDYLKNLNKTSLLTKMKNGKKWSKKILNEGEEERRCLKII
jgi:hypothetical protein